MEHRIITKEDKETLEMCKYMAQAYRKRREELGLTKEEVAERINKPVSTVTKSENSFSIGLHEMLSIGRDVYWLDVYDLLKKAEAYAKEAVNQAEAAEKAEGAAKDEGAEK